VSDAERRSRLVGLKLRALVRDHLADDAVPEASGFALGAALRHGDEAWVLLDERPVLGAALAWMLRSGATSLNVVAEKETGLLARRAADFAAPVTVWHAIERSLVPAVPEPAVEPIRLPAHHEEFRALIESAGAEPHVEHGVLVGEVRGLEVCRVVDDPHLGTTRLEVGVGAHDREAFQMLHGDVPTSDSLARIVEVVAQHRRVDAPQHPLNRLAAERFLRWRLLEEPSLVGADGLWPSPPPVPRPNLKDPTPCVAVGRDVAGEVMVVCASGVDLDLVPYAADARSAYSAADPDVARPRLVIVTPSRDRIKVTGEIAGLLRHSVEFVSLD
jgi:hypothetical protein